MSGYQRVIEALKYLGGAGWLRMSVNKYEQELKASGSMLYIWQYDLRWAAQQLRNEKKLKPVHKRRDLPWELV
ncbi:hypothetical protein H3U73_01470 [Snodgrassella sp. W8124]|nr:hypothetical protein [Snodgrassella sp. W8124]